MVQGLSNQAAGNASAGQVTLEAPPCLLGVGVAASRQEGLGQGRRLAPQPPLGKGEGDLSFGVVGIGEDLVQRRFDDHRIHALLPKLRHERSTPPRTEAQPVPDPAASELGIVEPAPVLEVVQDWPDEPGRKVLSAQTGRQLPSAASTVGQEAERGFADLPAKAGLHQACPQLSVHDLSGTQPFGEERFGGEGELESVLEGEPSPLAPGPGDGDASHPGGRGGRGNRILVGVLRDGGFSGFNGQVRER